MKTFKIAALCLSMAAAAFTVQAKEVKYEADVAIVGGGPAGMVAAAYAAENGLKPILVEKLPGVGGNLMMLEITFGQRTKFTDQDQVYYPSDELIADFLAYSHYMVNPIMVRRFIERSGENIKWLTNRGVEIVGNTATELNGRRVGHIYKNVFPHRNFIEAMRKIILDNGGQIIVETRADKLIQNADGRVIGLHAKNYLNDDVIVHAKGGVILAAGGYGANPKLLKLLNPKNGRRFFNEGLSGDFSVSGNALRINGNYLYTLVDDDEKRDLETGSGAVFGYFGHALPGDKMTGLSNLFSGKGRMAEVAFVGSTIEEVAKKAGLDPKTVRATVDRYNKFCDEGVDSDFNKDRRYLRPVRKGPFYIVKGQHTICDTAGGLLVNEDAQVIGKNGDPIPGLYASGAMAGGKYGPSYVYNVATGYASASAMMGGTFAVQDIAKKSFNRKIVYTADLPSKK